MKVRFLAAVKEELDDAADYFELAFEGLGRRFREEVKLVLCNQSYRRIFRLISF